MTQPGQRLTHVVWVSTAALLVLLLAVTAGWLESGRRQALAKAEAAVRQVVAAAEADVNRNVMAVDLTLAGLPKVLAPASIPGGFDAEAAHAALSALHERHLLFTDITLVDEAGTALATALAATRRLDPELPAGLLARVRALPAAALVVSEPITGRASGERSLLLARPLSLPGAPPLVALAEVPASMLLTVAASSAASSGLRLAIERQDGLVLVTQPPDDRITGQRAAQPIAPAQADGQPRERAGRLQAGPVIEAQRPTLYTGILISASIPREAALAEWTAQRGTVLAVAFALALLIVASAGGAHWQAQRVREARRAASDAAAMLDQALFSMGDAFLLCDAADRVLRWNERYVELFPWLRPVLGPGVPFTDLAEAASQAVVTSGDEAERQAWIARRVALHRSADSPWEQVLGTGVAVHAVERRLPDGGVVSVYRDMTRTERQLAEAKQAAEAANAAKSQFLANMSHEIRTPLNAVLGLNELLLQSPLLAEQRRQAELMRTSGELLLSLINDILDLSRIEAGHLDLAEEVFEPATLAADVLAVLRERAQQRGLALHLHTEPQLPAQLVSDARRLRQVLFNLVGNALKFTESGSVTVRLGMALLPARPGHVTLHIEVEDTGIGIPPQALPTLFDRFTQVDASSARRHGGSGLGLAITREVLERLGGRIDVRSEPGRGSCFHAQLPCGRPQAPALPAPFAHRPDTGASDDDGAADTPQATAPEPAPRPFTPLRILVAEDNGVNQLLIETLLRRLGHEPHLVANGREAAEQAGAHDWDAVLMDMQMPEVDGLEATRAIRALPGRRSGVPVIAMTANARAEDRQACLAAGMDDYVSKPIDVAALRAALQRCVPSDSQPAPLAA